MSQNLKNCVRTSRTVPDLKNCPRPQERPSGPKERQSRTQRTTVPGPKDATWLQGRQRGSRDGNVAPGTAVMYQDGSDVPREVEGCRIPREVEGCRIPTQYPSSLHSRAMSLSPTQSCTARRTNVTLSTPAGRHLSPVDRRVFGL